MLAVALAIECADELVDGAKGAALPLIRHDLSLSYGQVGLLASVPLLIGGLLELPLGVLTGQGRRRRLAILGGGVVFVLTLIAVALAPSFAVLLAAFIAFYPASGAFVSLTQAEVMDIWPDRQAQVMARWDLTGSAGAVAGPLLVTAVLASGGGWRDGYLALAGLAALTWVCACLRKPAAAAVPPPAGHEGEDEDRPWRVRAREVIPEIGRALRDWRTLRWLLLIEVADLLVDVFTGFLALYLVGSSRCTWWTWRTSRPPWRRWPSRSGSGPRWPGTPCSW